MKTLLSVLIVLGALTGCQLFSEPKEEIKITYPSELEKVHSLILKSKTDDARIQVENYINKTENIHWFGHAYFLKGFLYEKDKNYEMAEKFYKQAIEHSANYDSKVQAKALYNLSFVYENSNKQDALLVTLNDLMRRRSFFSELTNKVEIPARLACAYGAQGKIKLAESFHKEASSNYDSLIKHSSFRVDSTELSKSLYYLGLVVYQQDNEAFETLVTKLSLGQSYLLASAEASNSVWSKNSTLQLKNAYDKGWGMVLSFEPKGSFDTEARKKRKQMGQLKMASQLYDLTHKVMAEEFPLSNVNRNSKEIMDQSKARLGKIQNFALSLSLGPEMTRSKKIKNTPLIKYVEKKQEPVQINKEVAKGNKVPKKEAVKEDINSETLPLKVNNSDIGKDPNL